MISPTHGQPEFSGRDRWRRYVDQVPANAGWDLARGIRLSLGADVNGGPLVLRVTLTEEAAWRGELAFEVTKRQVREYISMVERAFDHEAWSRRCRTDDVFPQLHPPAVALVDGDPRCASCIRVISASGPVEQEPLPWTAASEEGEADA